MGMKQITKTFIVLLSTVLSLIACNKEIDSPDSSAVSNNDGLKSYKFTLSSGDSKDTKSIITPDGEGIVFNWETSDQIGTYSDAGKTGGLNNANGTVDAASNPITFEVSTYVNLTAGSTVYCYYPYSASNDTNTDPASITLSIPTDQIQVDDEFDSSAMPLVSAPYEISSAIDEFGSDNIGDISFYNLGSVIELDIYSSTGAYGSETITGVSLEADKAISGDFSFNLKGVNTADVSTLNINGYTGTSVSVDIAASDDMSGKTNRGTAFRAYLVIAPAESVSGTITVTTDVTTYQYILPARDFKRATLKKFGLDLEKSGARVKPVTYTYAAVTSAPSDWTGYYILTNTDINKLGAAELDASNHIAVSAITKNLDGTITLASKPDEIYIEKIEGTKYAIKLSDGKYLGWSSGTAFDSKSTKPTSTDNPYLWTLNTGASYSSIKSVSDSKRTISYGGSDFRPYSSPSPINAKLFQITLSPLENTTITLNNTGKTISVSWSSVFGAEDYDVRCEGEGFDETKSNLIGTSTSFTVDNWGTYEITITANPENPATDAASVTVDGITIIDPDTPLLSATPSSLTWAGADYGDANSKTISITINASDSWSIITSTMTWAAITEDHSNNLITIYPKAANTSPTTDNTGSITIQHSVGGIGAEDVVINCKQEKQWDGKISLPLGSNPFSLETTGGFTTVTEKSYGGYTYKCYGTSFYYFASKALFLGKSGAYLELPAIAGYKLSTVKITTSDTCSEKVTVIIADTSGTAVAGGASKTMKTSSDFTWTLTSSSVNTAYRIQVSNGYNLQITNAELTYAIVAE